MINETKDRKVLCVDGDPGSWLLGSGMHEGNYGEEAMGPFKPEKRTQFWKPNWANEHLLYTTAQRAAIKARWPDTCFEISPGI